jgi:hypothetical protein
MKKMIKTTIRRKDRGTEIVSLSPLKAIRYQCLECVGWSPYEVNHCTDKLCPLYPYRFGKVPGHKGKGNVNNFIEK